jgi:protein tyrosine phosphatase (PTP) superfamily phosphohydrolase (DUF442 family)
MTAALDALEGVPNACRILPTVLTGGQPSAANLQRLRAAGGAMVLDLCDPMEPRSFDEAALVRGLGMKYVNVPVGTGTLTDQTIDRILAVLRQAGEELVLVHCASGNRVGGALIPFFMLDQGWEEEDAVDQAMRVGLRSAELLHWGIDYTRRHQAP